MHQHNKVALLTETSAGIGLRSGRSDVLDEVARILRCAVELKPTGHHRLEAVQPASARCIRSAANSKTFSLRRS